MIAGGLRTKTASGQDRLEAASPATERTRWVPPQARGATAGLPHGMSAVRPRQGTILVQGSTAEMVRRQARGNRLYVADHAAALAMPSAFQS